MLHVKFSSVELQTAMKFEFLQKKIPKEIYERFSDIWPAYSAVNKWYTNFLHEDFDSQL